MPDPNHEIELGSLEKELQALRDENDSLRAECQELRAEKKQHEDFLSEVGSLLPPSYDADDSMESIITKFVKDMSEVGRIIAKLTADYR
jgi:chromosome segregation ATPase